MATRIESGQMQLRSVGGVPMAQVQQQQVDYIGPRVAAQGASQLAQILDRMSANAFQTAGVMRQQEGLQFVADNKLTSEQVQLAKDGVDISLLAKKPGTKLTTEEIDLTVEFVTEFGDRQGPYERLLRAAMLGDHFRFTRIDAVLHSWKILEDILKSPTRVHPYFEGTWGPDEAQEMIPGGWNPVGTQVDV
jgi:glucose-6-phosphate 1-dehydrogenase